MFDGHTLLPGVGETWWPFLVDQINRLLADQAQPESRDVADGTASGVLGSIATDAIIDTSLRFQ
jgi:hypothetical protein